METQILNWIQLGGTGGLIIGLVVLAWALTTERLVPGARAQRAEKKVDQLTEALAAKNDTDREMTQAFREQTTELKATREIFMASLRAPIGEKG